VKLAWLVVAAGCQSPPHDLPRKDASAILGGALYFSVPGTATPTDDVETTQELLYGLYALIRVHFDKEEDIQLPVFDRQPPEAVAAIIERMGHEHAGAGHSH